MSEEKPQKIKGPFWVHDSHVTAQMMVRGYTEDGTIVNICSVHKNSRGKRLFVASNAELIKDALNQYMEKNDGRN